ncbi:MAG TPA: hypothetical protein VGQ76_09745 [Thermoanaerobaculia bacterium]|jgi:hypothetical protein|nr:hypothetical protein [Thermoanaerobaculia bacterium]
MTKEICYDSRIDRCRRRYGVKPQEWANESGVDRKVLIRYRSGELVPGVANLAKLVLGLWRITGLPIRASELYDLGESEPLGRKTQNRCNTPFKGKRFATRFDRFLALRGINPTCLAAAIPTTRQTIYKKRSGAESFTIRQIERVVRTLRRMGYDVRASYIVDVGEDVQHEERASARWRR